MFVKLHSYQFPIEKSLICVIELQFLKMQFQLNMLVSFDTRIISLQKLFEHLNEIRAEAFNSAFPIEMHGRLKTQKKRGKRKQFQF